MIQFLNTEWLIDPFLLERKGNELIRDGINQYFNGGSNYKDVFNKFDLAIKYITYDFGIGDIAEPFKRAGFSFYDPIDYSVGSFLHSPDWKIEEDIITDYQNKLTIIKNNEDAHNEIVCGCFVYSYSRIYTYIREDESLKKY